MSIRSFQCISNKGISRQQIRDLLGSWLAVQGSLRKVLLLPPDFTRSHSFAGILVQELYDLLAPETEVYVMPALGTHAPMTAAEKQAMFGSRIPAEHYLDHQWRTDVCSLGEIPASFVKEVSSGLVDYPIDVAVNKHLLDPSYDLILSIGQVLPHEVVGMANYTKNVVVGCGGKDFIDKSHFLGAVCGLETLMGRDHSPVRQVFDYAEENLLNKLPLQYLLTVTTTKEEQTMLRGLFLGRERNLFEQAVSLSQQVNLDLLAQPLKKVVVYLPPHEFKSTWLGNKAVYRTRMAIADSGELIILAPGVRHFGEDPQIDELIRKYGYTGTVSILKALEANTDLQGSLSAAAHLIHGSSEGRFTITYAVEHLSQQEIEGVGYTYLPSADALKKYYPDQLTDGLNRLPNGEEVFFVSNPAVGLWALQDSLR